MSYERELKSPYCKTDRLKEFDKRISLIIEAYENHGNEKSKDYIEAFNACLVQFRSLFKEELK